MKTSFKFLQACSNLFFRVVDGARRSKSWRKDHFVLSYHAGKHLLVPLDETFAVGHQSTCWQIQGQLLAESQEFALFVCCAFKKCHANEGCSCQRLIIWAWLVSRNCALHLHAEMSPNVQKLRLGNHREVRFCNSNPAWGQWDFEFLCGSRKSLPWWRRNVLPLFPSWRQRCEVGSVGLPHGRGGETWAKVCLICSAVNFQILGGYVGCFNKGSWAARRFIPGSVVGKQNI